MHLCAKLTRAIITIFEPHTGNDHWADCDGFTMA
jgi:hypothetical protein